MGEGEEERERAPAGDAWVGPGPRTAWGRRRGVGPEHPLASRLTGDPHLHNMAADADAGAGSLARVQRTRWLIRREWRAVGNFRAAVVEAGAPDGVGEGEGARGGVGLYIATDEARASAFAE